jgi:hypothetical protein
MAVDFVKGLQGTTLDDPSLGMSTEALHYLHNPPYKQSPVVINRVTQLAIDLYSAFQNRPHQPNPSPKTAISFVILMIET